MNIFREKDNIDVHLQYLKKNRSYLYNKVVNNIIFDTFLGFLGFFKDFLWILRFSHQLKFTFFQLFLLLFWSFWTLKTLSSEPTCTPHANFWTTSPEQVLLPKTTPVPRPKNIVNAPQNVFFSAKSRVFRRREMQRTGTFRSANVLRKQRTDVWTGVFEETPKKTTANATPRRTHERFLRVLKNFKIFPKRRGFFWFPKSEKVFSSNLGV